MMLENEQRLCCDWNSTTFCVTDLAFNEYVLASEKMRNYFFEQQICKTKNLKITF